MRREPLTGCLRRTCVRVGIGGLAAGMTSRAATLRRRKSLVDDSQHHIGAHAAPGIIGLRNDAGEGTGPSRIACW